MAPRVAVAGVLVPTSKPATTEDVTETRSRGGVHNRAGAFVGRADHPALGRHDAQRRVGWKIRAQFRKLGSTGGIAIADGSEMCDRQAELTRSFYHVCHVGIQQFGLPQGLVANPSLAVGVQVVLHVGRDGDGRKGGHKNQNDQSGQ